MFEQNNNFNMKQLTTILVYVQVIGRREDGSVNFDREWDDYKFGFGFLAGEFWAGRYLKKNIGAIYYKVNKLQSFSSVSMQIDFNRIVHIAICVLTHPGCLPPDCCRDRGPLLMLRPFSLLGNELVHKLTNAGRTYTLRVDLSNYAGESVYAKYSNFSVGPESDNYRLHVTGYDTSSSASKYSVSSHWLVLEIGFSINLCQVMYLA